MTRTLAQMFTAADATTACDPGTCLHNCAEWWLGRPSGESDAYLDELHTPHEDWLAASAKTTHAEPGLLAHWRHTPAASARHKMAAGHPGHIAPVRRIDADGTVWVRSTDMELVKGRGVYRPGSVATVPLGDVTAQMGLIFDGYARTIAGVLVVPEPPAPKPAPKPVPKPTPKPKKSFYVVRRGDTLAHIAAAHHVTLAHLERLNPQVKHPNVIHPGQKIRIH